MLRCGGGGVAVVGPSPVPVRFSRQSPWVLGSTADRSKQMAAMAGAICGAKVSSGPVFSGDRGGNLAR